MQYVANLTVPASTLSSSPAEAQISLVHRYVRRVQVMFPTNAAGLVGVALADGDSRFYPAPGSQANWITGDGVTVEAHDDEGFLLRSRPHLIKVRAYNSDTLYDRTIEVRVDATNLVLELLMQELINAIMALIARLTGGRS